TFTLAVNKSGTGDGTVTSTPVGITCGGNCAWSYASGTAVTLTATPTAGSVFTGWSGGGCTGIGSCTVTLTSSTTVTATFAPTFALTVGETGSGTVTSTPAGITCGASCSASYASGTVVTLTATPAAGSVFAGWSGVGCTGTGSCAVTLTAATTVTATFIPTFTLAVTTAGTGNGTVTSSPAGINCDPNCSASYSSGTVVTLTAAPKGQFIFTGWSGGGCSGTGACTVTLTSDVAVTATFDHKATLTVSTAGTGSGTVASTPAGITCGTSCSASYASGTVVTLTATPAADSIFTGWSGGGCTGTGSCTVTLTSATAVTATFDLQTFTLMVSKAGTSDGTVTSTPAGIACGTSCAGSYASGAVVTLTATPAAGSVFTGWSGLGCTGTGSCTVTLT